MTNKQRKQNDNATADRREVADITIKASRAKNDELTMARRSKADAYIDEGRMRNDQITSNRRATNDRNPSRELALFLLILLVLALGAYFIFA